VKIKDLNRQLDEGFLDNFISKVKTMAGGDGPTGILRALKGQNAALQKFADAIANATTPRVMQRVGNQLDLINDGTSPLPVKLIYQQALAAAVKISANDNIGVDTKFVGQTIKSNRMDIERLVLTSNAGDNNEVNLIFDAILGGTGTANIGVSVEQAVKIISLIVAATLIFIQTQQQDSEDVEVDPNALEAFKTASVALNKVLFMQNSPDLMSLSPNQQLVDNLEELVTITMLTSPTGVQKKYLNITTEEMQAVLATPPQLVSPAALTRLLSSHDNVEPAAVSAVVAKVEPLIQAQFKAWLEIAVTQQPPRAPAFDIYKQWAKTVYDAVDRMDFEAKPAAAAQAENNTEFKALDDSHTAGEEAVKRALASNPALPGPEIKRIYDAAAKEAYDKTK
jgi:hypothetical protein